MMNTYLCGYQLRFCLSSFGGLCMYMYSIVACIYMCTCLSMFCLSEVPRTSCFDDTTITNQPTCPLYLPQQFQVCMYMYVLEQPWHYSILWVYCGILQPAIDLKPYKIQSVILNKDLHVAGVLKQSTTSDSCFTFLAKLLIANLKLVNPKLKLCC